MPSIESLRGAANHPNVKAFLRIIRRGESHETDEGAFAALYGWTPTNGKVITDFADHPRQAFMSPWGWTSAAGAFQAMCAVPGKVKTDTWGDFTRWCAGENFRPSFSVEDQTLFAVWCISRRGALADVINGNVEVAIGKCNREWASLPGSPYGQPVIQMPEALRIWNKWLAHSHPTTAPPFTAPAPQPPAPKPETPMVAPIIAAAAFNFGTTLIGQLASIVANGFQPLAKEKLQKEMARHTDNPAVAEQVATSIIEAVKTSTNKEDPVEAVAAARTDVTGAAVAAAQESALRNLDALMPLLEKVSIWEKEAWVAEESSRSAAALRAHEEAYDMTPMLLRGAFVVLGLLILLVGVIVGVQVYKTDSPDTATWSALTGLIGWATGTVTTIYAYRFGTSRSSLAKDVVIGELSARNSKR